MLLDADFAKAFYVASFLDFFKQPVSSFKSSFGCQPGKIGVSNNQGRYIRRLAKERVKIRVSEGGHNIEAEVIERRYIRGIKNLFDIYLPIVDGAFIFDNSEAKHDLLADKQIDCPLNIVNSEKFNLLKKYYDNN